MQKKHSLQNARSLQPMFLVDALANLKVWVISCFIKTTTKCQQSVNSIVCMLLWCQFQLSTVEHKNGDGEIEMKASTAYTGQCNFVIRNFKYFKWPMDLYFSISTLLRYASINLEIMLNNFI